MENKNKRVLFLTLFCFLTYLFTSIIFQVLNLSWEPFDRVNLISDIFPVKKVDSIALEKKKLTVEVSPQQDFDLYKKGNLITNFRKNDSAVLPNFLEKLQKLKQGEKLKIRIAYFGDSMIESDLLTSTLRKLLQQEYGGLGVGYLPIFSSVAEFRQTATSHSSGWKDISFKSQGAKNLYFSGHKFWGNGYGAYTDNTITDSTAIIEKSIIFGHIGSENMIANGKIVHLSSTDSVNRKVLAKDKSNSLNISSNTAGTFYGISFESESGIFVDNFSFRGITGVELKKLDEDFIKSIQNANHYDLIVFQYGVNLLFKPDDTNYSYYVKMMNPVLKKFKNSLPDAEFLIVSTADRAFRYDGEYKTAIGLPNLLEIQAKLAFNNGFAFYNQFETMGGTGSIVKWATENPPLANKDYVHPNAKGADVLGKKLFEAIQKEYQKYRIYSRKNR